MPAQDIKWRWVALAAAVATALVVVLFLRNDSGGNADLSAGAAAATTAPARVATTTTIADPPLTQPPIAGEPSVAAPARTPLASTAASTAQTTMPSSKAPTPVTTAALVFLPPTIGSASATDCRLTTGPGPALAAVEWVAHVSGGSNWRVLNATRSQPVLSDGKGGQAYDLWFTTPTPLPPAGQMISLPTSIKFASTVPSDSTVRAVEGPTMQVPVVCH